jgi:hypothetical protein
MSYKSVLDSIKCLMFDDAPLNHSRKRARLTKISGRTGADTSHSHLRHYVITKKA